MSAVIITVFAAWFIDRRKQDYRVERDLLLQRAEQTRELLKRFDSLTADSSGYDYTAASSVVKNNRVALAGLRNCLSENGYLAAVEKCESIDKRLAEIRDLLTDGPVKKGRGKGTVKRSRVTIDAGTKILVESTVASAVNDYFDLKLLINSA